MTPCLRNGRIDDAGPVARFFAGAFSDTFGHLYPPEDLADFLGKADAAAFAAELADPAYAFRIVEVGADAGGIAGFAKLGPNILPFDPEGRRALELRQLYLAPALKGCGVADALMQWAVDTARSRSFERLCLGVYSDNHRARRFYARHGFVEIGTYGFPVGRVVDDERILMRCL